MPEHEGGDVIQNNGGLKKTLEEINADKEKEKKEREKRFYNDPDSFVEVDKLIFGIISSSQGLRTTISSKATRALLEQAHSRMNYVIFQQYAYLTMMDAKKQQQDRRIITPGQKVNPRFRGFLGGGKK